jgi:osmotically-inducible protein OsmY
MKKLFVLMLLAMLVGCGTIESGNVGVRTAWDGEVQLNEESQGFYTSWISSVDEYTAREVAIELRDLQPKAKDNLSLEDMDVDVYYQTASTKIADLKVKYTDRDANNGQLDALWFPAYHLVRGYARNVVYEEVARHKSLEIHEARDEMARSIKNNLQTVLDQSDPGAFTVTKVVIRKVKNDSTVEQAIKEAVAKDKILDAKKIEIAIAKEQVKINHALDKSLTAKILRSKELDVMEKAVDSGSQPLIIFGSNATPLINIPAK